MKSRNFSLVIWVILGLTDSSVPSSLSQEFEGTKSDHFIDIHMPKVRPTKNDDYICTSKKISDLGTQYLNKFEPNGDVSRAHHMLLYMCDDVEQSLLRQGHWDCAHHYMACENMRILYAWAKNAPPTVLPDDVGFRIGPESNITYLVLQVHYAHSLPMGTEDESGFRVFMTTQEPHYIAGMMLMLQGGLTIPAKTEVTHGDINCQLKATRSIVPFAYRVHTHQWGSVVSGYYAKYGETTFRPLAKGNPQWPQAFYPMKEKPTINPGDLMAARCTFNTTGNPNPTRIGMTAGDEMCNLYIMFYTISRDPEDHSIMCINEAFSNVNAALPYGSDIPLPRNKTLEEYALGLKHVSPILTEGGGKSHAKKRPGIEPLYVEPPSDPNPSEREDRQFLRRSDYRVVSSWPKPTVKVGQASGVDFDREGNIVVFHRGDRTWDYNTFDAWNRYKQKSQGPIATDTVVVIHPSSGEILHQWGRNRFYMPHDITIAPNGDTFLTDVALHQVFKFKPGDSEPSLTLGEAFIPGKDDQHFCKPAAVAIMASGDFFVADGYCNSRIIKFDKKGRKVLEWGRFLQPSVLDGFRKPGPPPPYTFSVPHALALAEDQDLICVADRENGRIQCFSAFDGKFKFQVNSASFGGRVFSVAYSAVDGGTLFAVNGPGMAKVQGFAIPLSTKEVASVFSPNGNGFNEPHDIVASRNGSQIYVVEISDPYKVWKFERISLKFGKANSDPVYLPVISDSPKTVQTTGPNIHSAIEEIALEPDSIGSSVMLMIFLTIPLVLLVGVGALLRLKSRPCCKKRKEAKSFAEFFPPSAGFEKLRMDEESESDNSEAEVEEFTKPGYKKSLRT